MQNKHVTRENHSEDWHQKQLIQWARKFGWGQFLYHIPNESIGGIKWVTRNRQMGCRKGVPDLCLPIPMSGYHGLYIELKTDRGRLNEDQKRWLKNLSAMGYRTKCCRGWKEAAKVLAEYMNEDETATSGL